MPACLLPEQAVMLAVAAVAPVSPPLVSAPGQAVVAEAALASRPPASAAAGPVAESRV
jgi:hypothetical protein